ncbi:cyclic nucleotide-binding/CBS domain-containing protein [Hyalangium rubrum]|uniref:CBS domain-containing protein n=1 Tax=Hyalangium rubrum TaxID=3103134 RepID=A0ABU5HFT6_9BACT|nr:CBS domain-containing protein [Hyalangium sp. s54d21]MDY7231672.1 CBS domain-containing protein [Hyalangium sp. s54d21]
MKGHARNMMTAPVLSVGPDASLAEIARCMAGARIGGVPVVGAEGRVEGFVSESDLLGALLAERALSTRASEIMTHSVLSVDEFDRTEEVMELLRKHRIHHLPVLRAGQLVGMITPSDVVRFMVEHVLTEPPKVG